MSTETRKQVKSVEVMTAKAVNAITDKRGHRTVCEHLCSWWAGRWRDRDIGSRYIYNDPICMQMAAYRTDLSHSYSYVTEGSVHVSFLLLFCLPLFSPLLLYFSLSLSICLALSHPSMWLLDPTSLSIYTRVSGRANNELSLRREGRAKCIDCA